MGSKVRSPVRLEAKSAVKHVSALSRLHTSGGWAPHLRELGSTLVWLGSRVLGLGFEDLGSKLRSPVPLEAKSTAIHEETSRSPPRGAGEALPSRVKRTFL